MRNLLVTIFQAVLW